MKRNSMFTYLIYPPSYRTILLSAINAEIFENYYLKFPKMAFLIYRDRDSLSMYPFFLLGKYIPLAGIFPNVFAFGICLRDYHGPDSDEEIVNYFWNSTFAVLQDEHYCKMLEKYQSNPDWFNTELHGNYGYILVDARNNPLLEEIKGFPKEELTRACNEKEVK